MQTCMFIQTCTVISFINSASFTIYMAPYYYLAPQSNINTLDLIGSNINTFLILV